jgi:hypothetical protein
MNELNPYPVENLSSLSKDVTRLINKKLIEGTIVHHMEAHYVYFVYFFTLPIDRPCRDDIPSLIQTKNNNNSYISKK